jgi:anti-anti-sigma factor
MSIAESITLEEENGVTVVSFGAVPVSITEEELPQISEQMLKSVAGQSSRVLVDLGGVEFFSSSFIELLFRIWNRVRNKPGGQFAICRVEPHCREVLEITNLTSLWSVFAGRDEALSALRADGTGR